ncbi:hypothetical protein QK900_07840 [Arsenicicoccus dermatophilus]|uniref:hypothetical protein n=1 Tax=Arsenicicoccus dermatophilus TaxID=1076331 RepID=UPI003891FA96
MSDRSEAGAQPARFRAVRDRAEDEEWATEAWLALVLRGHVEVAAAEHALGEVLELVRSSGEGPEELYGPPDRWAEDTLRRWAAEGSDAIQDPPTRWRDLPQVAAVAAVGVTLVCALVCVLRTEWSIDWTLAWVLFPFLGSVVALGAITTWESVVTRWSTTWGAAAVLVVIAAGSLGIAALFAVTDPRPLAHASIGWHLPLAAAHAALAWLLGRVIPDPGPEQARPLTDEAWVHDLARILRTRGELPEPQVGRVLEDARAHGQQTGAPLVEEFGSPAAYAAQVCPRPIVRSRRSAIHRTAVLALCAWPASDLLLDASRSWPARVFSWLALACLTFLVLRAWWHALAHRVSGGDR